MEVLAAFAMILSVFLVNGPATYHAQYGVENTITMYFFDPQADGSFRHFTFKFFPDSAYFPPKYYNFSFYPKEAYIPFHPNETVTVNVSFIIRSYVPVWYLNVYVDGHLVHTVTIELDEKVDVNLVPVKIVSTVLLGVSLIVSIWGRRLVWRKHFR